MELKEKRIWVLKRKAIKDGQEVTIYVDAAGNPIRSEGHLNVCRLMTYQEAMAAMELIGADGLAYITPAGYCCLSICQNDPTHPYAQLMLTRYDSYAERSADGSSLHIVGQCDVSQLPVCMADNGRRKLNNNYMLTNQERGLTLILSDLSRHIVTYTGDVVWDRPVIDCTAAVRLTLDKDLHKPVQRRYSAARDGDRKIYDLINQLRDQANGSKFSVLFDEGNLAEYASHEAADVALCTMVAFRAGPDPLTITQVFGRSALYYSRWENAAYRDNVIRRAIKACNGKYHEAHMPHPPFVKYTDAGKPYISPPLLARYIRDNLDYLMVRDNGKHGLVNYVYKDGCYKLYSDEMLLGTIKSYIAQYDEELIRMSAVKEVLQLLRSDENTIRQDELDADQTIINFKNGILEIDETATKLVPHSPEYHSTIQLACDWPGQDAPTPVFDKFLHTLTDGDEAVKELLLEYIGVCLSNIPGWKLKKSLFMIGVGDTGKSQLKLMTERLLGPDNYIGIDLSQIEARFGTGAIYGMRLAGCADMGYSELKELSVFKRLTGGDSILGEFKGQQAFSFVYNGMLWFCSNRLPAFSGDHGSWVYNRIMVVTCKNVIPPEQQDKHLQDKLWEEREGIVYKVIRALQTVIANGYRFSEPESVKIAREKYMVDNDPALMFFREYMCPRITYKPAEDAHSQQVYDAYRAWHRRNFDTKPVSNQDFKKALASALGIDKDALVKRGNSGTVYRHYTLTNDGWELYNRISMQQQP